MARRVRRARPRPGLPRRAVARPTSGSRVDRPPPAAASSTPPRRWASPAPGPTRRRRRRAAGRPHPRGHRPAGLRRARRLQRRPGRRGRRASPTASSSARPTSADAARRAAGADGVAGRCRARRRRPAQRRCAAMTRARRHPSPTQGVWELGPLPLRAYALCIVAGIVAAVADHRAALGGPRRRARRRARHRRLGGAVRHHRRPDLPRHLQPAAPYFGEGGDPLRAFAIWEGGLGIWGAIALGGVGAWIGCRRRGHPAAGLRRRAGARACSSPRPSAGWATGSTTSCTAGPTDLPWGLQIYEWDRRPRRRSAPTASRSCSARSTRRSSTSCSGTWRPPPLVIWADRRFRLGHGRAFALYVAAYCVGPAVDRAAAHRPGRALLRRAAQRLHLGRRRPAGAVAYLFWQRGRPREVIDRGPEGRPSGEAGGRAPTGPA